jgi:hypothetical protein
MRLLGYKGNSKKDQINIRACQVVTVIAVARRKRKARNLNLGTAQL